jgi:hypothetical protein
MSGHYLEDFKDGYLSIIDLFGSGIEGAIQVIRKRDFKKFFLSIDAYVLDDPITIGTRASKRRTERMKEYNGFRGALSYCTGFLLGGITLGASLGTVGIATGIYDLYNWKKTTS